MKIDLNGKVALVSGGASGIGEAVVKEFATAGADVAILDKDESGMASVVANAKAAGRNALGIPIDLRDMERIPIAVRQVIDELGRIDIFVHNAAVANVHKTLLELDLETWDLIQDVNLKAAMYLTKHIAAHMVERGSGGKIVYVASSAAYRPKSPPAYGASKSGLVQFMRSVAAELGPHDINVNAVAPGLTNTPGLRTFADDDIKRAAVGKGGVLENLMHRWAEPWEVAQPILFLCLPASRQMTGQVLHTSAGAVAP